MNCVKHHERSGVNTCGKCGEWLCEDCSFEVDGRVVCKNCVTAFLNGNAKAAPAHETRGEYYEEPHRCTGSGRKVNGLLLFIFSMLPGANYMYMGLIRKGLFAMSAFFLTIYCISSFNMPYLGLIIPILWCASFFDGFEIRRRLRRGEHVEDNNAAVIHFLKKYKVCFIVLLVSSVCVSIITELFSWFPSTFYYNNGWAYHGPSVFSIVIVGLGIYFLVKAMGRRK